MSIAIASLIVLGFLFSVGCCCAGVCRVCAAETCPTLQVTLADIANDTCTTCANLNGVYLLDGLCALEALPPYPGTLTTESEDTDGCHFNYLDADTEDGCIDTSDCSTCTCGTVGSCNSPCTPGPGECSDCICGSISGCGANCVAYCCVDPDCIYDYDNLCDCITDDPTEPPDPNTFYCNCAGELCSHNGDTICPTGFGLEIDAWLYREKTTLDAVLFGYVSVTAQMPDTTASPCSSGSETEYLSDATGEHVYTGNNTIDCEAISETLTLSQGTSGACDLSAATMLIESI